VTRKRYIGVPGGGWQEVGEPEVSSGVMIVPDIKPYQNMVDGKMVEGRRQHREFIKRNNLIEIGNDVKYETKAQTVAPGLKQTIIEIAAEKLRYR
jgi:hypothetical protein